MDNLDQNWVATAFGVRPSQVTVFCALIGKTSGGVNSPDLVAFLAQQLILLPDGFPRFVFVGAYDANDIDQLDFNYQNFLAITDTGSQMAEVTKFDEIIVQGNNRQNQMVLSGYLVDRLIP